MLSLTKLHSHHLIPNTSTQLSSMPPSHTRPTKRDTSAHSRLLTPASISRVRKEVEIPQTTQPSFCMPRDSKIFQSSKDSEISSEFTEQPSDSTTTRDSSTPTSSTTHLGLFSQLTEDQLSRKSRTRTQSMIWLPSLTLESTSPLRRTKELLFKTLESGLSNTSLNTMSSPDWSFYHLAKLIMFSEKSTP